MRSEFWLPIIMVTCGAWMSCGRWDGDGNKGGRWDADKHYVLEKQAVEQNIQLQKVSRIKAAEQNIAKVRNEATTGVSLGLSASSLQKIAGYRYSLLARTANGDQLWERRRYLLSEVVASRWGSFSLESRLCDKDAELFTITLVNGIVREVDYGY